MYKETTTDRIEYLPEQKTIQVREVTRIIDNDVIIAQTYFRYVIDSSTDVKTITDEKLLAVYNATIKKESE